MKDEIMNSLEKSYEEYLKNKTKGALKNDKNIYQAGFIAGLSRGAKLAALRAYPVRAIWNEIEKISK
jgi:hypothetical protein